MSAGALDDQGLPRGYPFRPEFEVLPRAVRDALQRDPPSALLVDVRHPDEVQLARVESAMTVPLHELESRLEEIEEAVAALGDAPVYTICHHGMRSLKAAIFLRDRGLESAFSVAGGIDLWSLDIDPRISRYHRDPSGRWVITPS